MKSAQDYYKEMNSDEDQKKVSLTLLAEKMECMPWELKEKYKNELSENNLTISELKKVVKKWKKNKRKEGKFFNIKPENTTSDLLENWTREFINENF